MRRQPTVLTFAHHERPDGGQARVLHGTSEERVHLLAAFLGQEVVAALEVDRIDLFDLDEVGDLKRPVPLRPGGLEVFVFEFHIFAVAGLVCLDDLVVGDLLALLLADLLVADGRGVLAMQEVEVEGMLGHRRDHANRNRDETEGNRSRPDRARHTWDGSQSARAQTVSEFGGQEAASMYSPLRLTAKRSKFS